MQGAGQLIQGNNNVFDGLNRLHVNGIEYSPASDQSSVTSSNLRSIDTPSAPINGLNVSRQVSITTGAADVARTIENLSNPTDTLIAATVRLVGNLGSDDDTVVFATSDGDLMVEPTDTWFGTDDADGSGSPAVIHLLHGTFGIVPNNVEVIGDNVAWEYSLTVPSHRTVRLATFTLVGNDRTLLIDQANALVGTQNGLTSQASEYLSAAEVASLINFHSNQAPTAIALSNDSLDENSPIGSIVGAISTSDSDASDSHVYTLIFGERR